MIKVGAVIDGAGVPAKQIVLTGLAVMLGGFFIVDDPIFQSMVVSRVFGIVVSIALIVLSSHLYFGWLNRGAPKEVAT